MNWGGRHGLTGLVAFLALVAVMIGSVTMLIWLGANGGSVLTVLPFCVGAWGAYVCAHYLVAGQFVDESEASDASGSGQTLSDRLDSLPASSRRWALSILGISCMFLTFPTGIVAVGADDFALLAVSATLFVGGYIVGHLGVTRSPL